MKQTTRGGSRPRLASFLESRVAAYRCCWTDRGERMPNRANLERALSQSRWLVLVLSVSLPGCAELIMGVLTPPAKFEHSCADAFAPPALGGEERGYLRFGTKAADRRNEVAVVVLVPLGDPCEPLRESPPTPRWTISINRVDGSDRAVATDSKTGADRRVKLENECNKYCSECMRIELAPGQHTLDVDVGTAGSRSTSAQSIYGTATFSASPNGLYGVCVCKPDRAKQPLFWIRDERTLECVSSVCPGSTGGGPTSGCS